MKTLAELLTAAVDGEFDVPEHTRAVVAGLVDAVQEWLGQADLMRDELGFHQADQRALIREAGRGLDA